MHSWRGFAEGVLQVVLLAILWYNWSMKKHCVAKILLAIWEYFYMKIIVTIIAKYVVTNLFLSSFFISYKLKTRIWFSASWWSGNEKYFCFLFIASRALLQSHAEFNRLLERNFLTCYSCTYYSFMVVAHSFEEILFCHMNFIFSRFWSCSVWFC